MVDDAIVADGLDFDEEEEDAVSAPSSLNSSACDDSGVHTPSESPLGSQIEGQLCPSLILSPTQSHPTTTDNTPTLSIPPVVNCSTTASVAAAMEEAETVDATQVEGGVIADGASAETNEDMAAEVLLTSTSSTSPAQAVHEDAEEEVGEEGGLSEEVNEWSVVKEAALQPTSTLFMPALKALKSRLLPFAPLHAAIHTNTGTGLNPYASLFVTQQSIAQAMRSPMRFTQPQM